ncbi:phage portal protein [Mycolicibacterium sp. OfavD-34-C]|uniref:phage portal protein n=1 Tax=Mycolicibacterium sp. OfavD-34-C TaxID=2917746 RepID=UPI001EF5E128|nr:phage portal protein [Mycolicibacterium sp. OfavD-34-C]MCG7582784.1 phage portal protein [Mycolicibacterium sp. OfavD-34-C]
MTDLLTTLLQKIDEPAAKYADLERYYSGTQPLAFLASEAREALGTRFGRMATNLPRLAITSLTERLRVSGFTGVDVWDDWLRNDMDELSAVAHREALLLGSSYVLVWVDQYSRPLVTVESAKQMACLRDPGTRRITHAIKRWETDTTTEAVLYGPDEIIRYRANSTGATTAGFKVIDTIRNPLGVPPVVRLLNSDRILDEGVSEIEDLKPLVDALNKILVDMMVASEYTGRPRRYATGIELEEEPVLDENGEETGETVAVNPYPESNRMMIAEEAAAKFGQLEPGDLSSYNNAVDILLSQVSANSALPHHYLGILENQPASADSLRASEASLTSRAEARQKQFGRAWEDVARLIVAVRDGVDPLNVDVRCKWSDASTRSVSAEADATVKLVSAGVLPVTYALQRLGYTDDEIEKIRVARRTEALDTAGVNLLRPA